MATLINRVMFRATSSGTGSFVVSSAITGYMTPATGGAANATVYSYAAESDDRTEWEIGTGTYTSGTTTLTRTPLKSSNSDAVVNFTAAPRVALTGLAADFVKIADTDASGFGFVVDEDDMASNSATKVPTQQSVKAYVDGAEVKEENIDPTPLGFYTTEGSGVRLWKFADRVLVGDAVTYNGGKNGTEMNSAQSDFAANTKIRWTERDAQFIVASTEGITAILGETRSSRRSGYFDASRQRAPVGVAGLGVTDSTDYDSGARAAYFEGWVQHTGGGTHNRGAVGIEISIADSRSGGVQDNPYKGMGSLALGMWISSSLSSELGGTAGPSSSAIKIGLGNDTFYKGLVFNAGAIEGADGATTTGRGRAIEMAIGHEIGWRNGNSGADTPSAGAHIRYTGIGTAGFTGMLLGNRSVQIIGATAYADEKTLLEITAPSSGDADNYLSISAVASPGPPTLSAVGSSTNIDLWMQGKGTGKLVAYHPDTSVSAVTEALQLRHSVTSGTPAAGIGTGVEYVTQNGVGSNKIGMALHMVSTDVTNGSEDFDFVVRLMAAGAAHAEKFRVRSTGEPVFRPPASATALATNGEVTMQLTNNTTLRLIARGSDGTTRGVNLTLS